MTAQRLTSDSGTLSGCRIPRDGLRAAKPLYAHAMILSLAVAVAGSGLGCGDDKTAADASATGGAGGAGARGGSGGSGGTAGRGGAGGSGGTAGTGGTTGGTGGSASDASSTGGTAGTGTGGAGGTAGTGGTGGTGGGTDAGVDMALPVDLPVDQPLPVDLPPDNPPAPTTVNVSDCAQFMCPELTSIASQCQANETTCVHSKEGSNQTNYCHSNGVKKVAHSTFNGAAYSTTLRVYKANSGDDCYTLEIQGTGGTPDMQNWTYKSNAGATLATATWRSDTNQLTIRCGNTNYVFGNVGCPGTDGQPDDTSLECPAGTCSEP